MDNLFLQIFLLVNVFIAGALIVVAIQHARAHFKPQVPAKHAPEQSVRLPPAVKEHLLQASQAHFQAVLDHAVLELRRDLKGTTDQLNKKLETVGGTIVESEMKRYQASLEMLREQTEKTIGGAVKEVATHQTDLKSKLEERRQALESQIEQEIEQEKQLLMSQIDTKLADAVTSFLIETLQHNVDLGAQSNYLISMLDEHKDELTKGIRNDA